MPLFVNSKGQTKEVSRKELNRLVKLQQAAFKRAGKRPVSQKTLAKRFGVKPKDTRARNKYGRFVPKDQSYVSDWYVIKTPVDNETFIRAIHDEAIHLGCTESSHNLRIEFSLDKGLTQINEIVEYVYTPKESMLKPRTFGVWLDVAMTYRGFVPDGGIGPGMRYNTDRKSDYMTADIKRIEARFSLYPRA